MIRSMIRFVPVIALLTGLTLVTSACGMFYDNSGRRSPSRSTPAAVQPVETAPRGPFAAVPPPGAPAIPVPASGVHRVERGNTVYSISRLYGVPVRAIIETNGLTPPYLLKVGNSLTIPRRRGHRVAFWSQLRWKEDGKSNHQCEYPKTDHRESQQEIGLLQQALHQDY